ncbi:glutathione S-transferase family protein [Aliikangiella coralliicola]|uniref:Glutathione S-transferase family protein n=1 Tax=Aliikangiella coralliicola TaxID=2592383 RepID=A0A545U6H4_9GAMM|nr:glutathione S-transferase family protein [Aliikangiella coralliicola]TQV85080.1 glutathione S-transferase family protein [Aliikangiella coralliicola]
MKLYYHPVSTYSQKVLIALYEKQITFDSEIVQLFDPEVKANYEKIYPIGKIPLLIVEDDWKIPESTIIVEYLEGNFEQGTQLIPSAKEAARHVRFHDRMSDLYLNDPTSTLLFELKKAEDIRDQDKIARACKYLDLSYRYLDDKLRDSDWLMGESFTLADCATIPPLFYAQQIHPFGDYANLTAYYKRANARESYEKVLSEALPALEKMGM